VAPERLPCESARGVGALLCFGRPAGERKEKPTHANGSPAALTSHHAHARGGRANHRALRASRPPLSRRAKKEFWYSRTNRAVSSRGPAVSRLPRTPSKRFGFAACRQGQHRPQAASKRWPPPCACAGPSGALSITMPRHRSPPARGAAIPRFARAAPGGLLRRGAKTAAHPRCPRRSVVAALPQKHIGARRKTQHRTRHRRVPNPSTARVYNPCQLFSPAARGPHRTVLATAIESPEPLAASNNRTET
jgi:hypothetical protein